MGFEPHQLHALFLKAVTEDKTYLYFASLRQLAVYVLLYWGTARFREVQELRMDNLICRGSHFEVVLQNRIDKIKVMESIPIYPTSSEYPNSFCPVSILTSYCNEHNKLVSVEGVEFLFPKMSSNFEKGGELQILTIASPPKCIPRECFNKKFIAQIDSQELRDVGVNTSKYFSDSFRLGEIKFMD